MKWLYFVTLLLLCGLTTARRNRPRLDIKQSVKERFEKKCENVGGITLVEKLRNSTQTAKTCFGEFKSYTSEGLCSKMHFNRECYVDFIETIKECSQPEEKYLPEFVFDALHSLLNYLCADEEALISKLSADRTLKCALRLARRHDITYICNDIFSVLDNTIVTKSQLCEILTNAKTCYTDFVQKRCPNDLNLKEYIAGMYNALSSPCRYD